MSLLGKNIHLTGISQKGKNRIRDHGYTWTVLAETDHVLFSTVQPGPWLFISPDSNQNNKASRWIRLQNDPDFMIAFFV